MVEGLKSDDGLEEPYDAPHDHPRDAQDAVAHCSQHSRNAESNFGQPSPELQVGGVLEVLVSLQSVGVGLVDILLDQVDIASLLHDDALDLLLDFEVVLHALGQFLELGGRDLELLGTDFLLEDEPAHPPGQLLLAHLGHHDPRVAGQVELALLLVQHVLAFLVDLDGRVPDVADLRSVAKVLRRGHLADLRLRLGAQLDQFLGQLDPGLGGLRRLQCLILVSDLLDPTFNIAHMQPEQQQYYKNRAQYFYYSDAVERAFGSGGAGEPDGHGPLAPVLLLEPLIVLIRVGEHFQDLVQQFPLLLGLQLVELTGDALGCLVQQHVPDCVLVLLLPVGLHAQVLPQPARPQLLLPGRPLLAALAGQLVQQGSPGWLLLQEGPVEPVVLLAHQLDLLLAEVRVGEDAQAPPEVVGGQGLHQDAAHRGLLFSLFGQLAEGVGEVGPAQVHDVQQLSHQLPCLWGGRQAQLLGHLPIVHFLEGGIKEFINVLVEDAIRDKDVKGFRQLHQVPLDDLGLPPVAVSLVLVRGIADIVLREVVDEPKGAIVDGHIDHAHVVCVEHPVDKPDGLPESNQLGSSHHDQPEQLLIRVSFLFVNLRVEVLNQIISQGDQGLPVLYLVAPVHLGILVADLEAAESEERLGHPQDDGCIFDLDYAIVEGVPHYIFLGNHEAQGPGGRHLQACHELRNQELPHGRADNTVAVSMPGEGAQSTPLQLQFICFVAVADIAEGVGTSVTKLASPHSELVTTVVMADGHGASHQLGPRQVQGSVFVGQHFLLVVAEQGENPPGQPRQVRVLPGLGLAAAVVILGDLAWLVQDVLLHQDALEGCDHVFEGL